MCSGSKSMSIEDGCFHFWLFISRYANDKPKSWRECLFVTKKKMQFILNVINLLVLQNAIFKRFKSVCVSKCGRIRFCMFCTCEMKLSNELLLSLDTKILFMVILHSVACFWFFLSRCKNWFVLGGKMVQFKLWTFVKKKSNPRPFKTYLNTIQFSYNI